MVLRCDFDRSEDRVSFILFAFTCCMRGIIVIAKEIQRFQIRYLFISRRVMIFYRVRLLTRGV